MRLLLGVMLVGCVGCCTVAHVDAGGEEKVEVVANRYQDPPLPGLKSASSQLPEKYKRAIVAQGTDYKPRAHHRYENQSPKFTNRLIFETSPYLLQHAHNPVSWYPWGDEAFRRAEEENKLVLLSVGYSTCRWCHVMERESFEDLEIASYMNANYVVIKVDREERPDVDSIYMTAVGILAGRGGWPMTVILTPDRLPVFAGTYFPPRDGARGSRRGFLSILKTYRELYLENPNDLIASAQEVASRLLRGVKSNRYGKIPKVEGVLSVVDLLKESFDPVHGGFGRAPKFPRSVNIELLLRYYHRSGDKAAFSMALETLKAMAYGGMYDHIGGGFHRYSTDRRWLVPHFEKMLYDNAQLVAAYLEAYQLTGDDLYGDVAKEVLDYIGKEMTYKEGGFYSATDADSPTGKGHDEEGLFFTWTIREVDQLLQGDSKARDLIKQFYNMTSSGNFEGRNILHVTRSLKEAGQKLGLSHQEAKTKLREAKQVLYKERLKRLPPILDDKILVSWNGLMISAFARAGFTLQRDDYLQRATRAANFILTKVRDGGRLKRSFRRGRVRHDAYLDDYAFLIQGLLDLYEGTSKVRWLDEAVTLQEILDKSFWDKGKGGYYFISEQTEIVLAREKPSYDGAEPSGNSVAALNLLRLELLTGNAEYRNRAMKLFQNFSQSMTVYGRSVPKMLSALDYFHDEPVQVVVVEPDGPGDATLREIVAQTYLPNHAFTIVSEKEALQLGDRLPVLLNKTTKRGLPTAYVCRGPICSLPITAPKVLKKELAKVRPYKQKPTAPNKG